MKPSAPHCWTDRRSVVGLALCCAVGVFPHAVRAAQADDLIPLAGTWEFHLDPQDQGVKEQWFAAALPLRTRLPGSTDENGYGTKTTGRVPHWLNRVYEYVGPAWYGREVVIPAAWQGKRIVLFLERCHWETQVWVDGKPAGMQDSLCTPQEYELTGLLPPGKHRLAIRVDNRLKINVGSGAHSVCDHTQTNWNGIVGRIELRATERLWIADVQVYPNVAQKAARVVVTVGNATGQGAEAAISLAAAELVGDQVRGAGPRAALPPQQARIAGARETAVTVDLPLGEGAKPWDEFSPARYELTVSLSATSGGKTLTDARRVRFGLREFRTHGTQFTINGRPTFLRGTLECCIFPLTGYPATAPEGWQRIIRVAKAHGLNHFRFHSWCPPEAAFEAADREGFYFHVETPVWTVIGSDPKTDAFIYAEGDRILRAYGNHPSFCMLCVGNEPDGNEQFAFFSKIISYWKAKDPRRVYTSGSGHPVTPESDYHSRMDPRMQVGGDGMKNRVNSGPLSTEVDYRAEVKRFRVPVVSHEIGQWCVFPNFDEIPKYTGVLRARNLEFYRDLLAKRGRLDQAHEFLIASGKLQALLYKEEIETALRTPGFGGFQLLDLHDFPGQGTALVGVVDAFWDSKGYITPAEYRRFCCETVPLLRMKKCTWTADETFTATAEVAHYGPAPLEKARPQWSVCDAAGRTVAAGEWPAHDIPLGGGTPLGLISLPLDRLAVPAKLVVSVSLAGTPYANQWDIWVYPAKVETAPPAGVLVTAELDQEMLAALAAGKRVLFLPPPVAVRSKVPPGFSSIFWNTRWTHGQPPHTLGILCDPKHPALAGFPTDFHSNWQWWDLITKSRAMILDDFPAEFRPIVQVIDDWNTNRNLGLILEAKVGGGSLLMCSIDLRTDLERRPVARQMLRSLLDYAAGPAFAPRREIDLALLRGLIKDEDSLHPLGTRGRIVKVDSEAPGHEAAKAIDGDPETCWHTQFSPTAPPFPHELVIELHRAAVIKGFRYVPRQNIANGRIAKYAFYLSDDAQQWGRPAAEGTFPPGAAEQRIMLAAPRKARYLRFVALSEQEGQAFASLAEFDAIVER